MLFVIVRVHAPVRCNCRARDVGLMTKYIMVGMFAVRGSRMGRWRTYFEPRDPNREPRRRAPMVKRPTGAGGAGGDCCCAVAVHVTPPQLPFGRATSHAHTSAASMSGRLATRRAVHHACTCPYWSAMSRART